jgi:hypothetical protein
MSALAENSSPTIERRGGERVRIERLLARAGRRDAAIADLGMRGARIRHEGALPRGATIRVTFNWHGAHFAASAEVLACRVLTLGGRDDEPAVYESRLRFVELGGKVLDLLARVITDAGGAELRKWVENLQGESAVPAPSTGSASGFIRCRYFGWWEKRWTRNPSQPIDGFTLPARTERSDIDASCKAWEGMDRDGRELVRATAAAVAEEQQSLKRV